MTDTEAGGGSGEEVELDVKFGGEYVDEVVKTL